jgi:purine-binding chemotaxis protein CheW
MSTETTRQLVVFSLGEEEYALPITQVHEIIRWTDPRSVASDEAWVRGVISLRGKIVPVCDLASHLGSAHTHDDAGGKVVIVEAGDSTAGILVDDVAEVLTITADDVDDVPTATSAAINGIAKVGDRLIVLLDAPGLVGALGLAPHAQAA